MIYLCLDLESIRDPAIPFAPEDPNAFAPLPCHQIVCGCWGKLTVTPEAAKLELGGERDEVALLRRLSEWWPYFTKTRPLVGWGTSSFDIPLIMARAMKHGIQFPSHYSERYGTRDRYAGVSYDLCSHLADFGAARKYGLHYAAQLMGFPGKTGNDGGDVQAMWDAGEIDAIFEYCTRDVIETVAVLAGSEHLAGRWTTEMREMALAECWREWEALGGV